MTSALARCPFTLLASLSTPSAEPPLLPTVLGWLDLILSVGTGLVMIAVLLLPGLGCRWLSLAEAQLPVHRLREESIIIAVLVYLLSAALASTAAGWVANDTVVAQVMAGVVPQILGIAVCAAIATRSFDGRASSLVFGHVDRQSGTGRGRTILVATLLSIGLCQLCLFVTVVTVRLIAPDATFEAHRTIQALRTADAAIGARVVLWVGAGLLAPLAEELFFRGLVQNYLITIVGSRWRAVLATSCVFALVHVPQPETVPALFLFGIVLGVAYLRSGALIVPVAIHALFNIRTLLWEAGGAFPS